MNRKFFGTDGVRGPYGGPVINEDFAARLGFAAAQWLRDASGAEFHRRALIGRDTRFSGPSLEAAVARGLAAAGMEPVSLGILPTPAVARGVRQQRAGLGVVITASHNPAGDNGIKFFHGSGVKLTDAQELQIEQRLPASATGGAAPFAAVDGIADYLDAMAAVLPGGALKGWRIVLDTANGATCDTSPVLLRRLGADVLGLGDRPDGRNINVEVGSEHPEKLAAMVRAQGARLGIAHDGDGDRCVLADETGHVLDGDEILAILSLFALQRGKLPRQTLVVTVQSNLGLDELLATNGGRVIRTPVGDRYVIEQMLAQGLTLGGESSGHIISLDLSPTGDGLAAALKVIEVMVATGEPLSKLRQALTKFPQLSAAVVASEKRPVESLPRLGAAIAAIEKELGSRGRVLVRWSGTEPKLRLLVEGPDTAVVEAGLARLQAAARSDLGLV